MALTQTTLASACGATASSITVTSATGFAVGSLIRVDNEFMEQTAAATGTNVPVRRGLNGSAAVAHTILAPTTVGLYVDFPNPGIGQVVSVPPEGWDLRTVAVDADFDPGGGNIIKNTLILIAQAAAYTATITGPTLAQDGLTVTYFSMTAYAHVITYTAGFHADTGSSDTATFAATYGNSFTMIAQGGKWGLQSTVGVTVA